MKVGIVGSRSIEICDMERYIPDGAVEIVSGGAVGVDRCATEYAISHGIKLTEFLPEYTRYGRWAAPLKRNIQIIEYSDMIIAFWDGKSKGTKYVIDNAKRMGKPVEVYILEGTVPRRPLRV